MNETQKPFACKANGCAMRFTTEDSLIGHKKKHAMSLPVGTDKAASFGVDQTPTPTSFIRTCDEYGLFDMLTCNPFEDSFRRTNEAKSISGTPNDVAPDGDDYKLTTLRSENATDPAKSQISATEDTLNTPHVLPYYSNVTVADCQFVKSPSGAKRCGEVLTAASSESSSHEKIRKVDEKTSPAPNEPMKMPKLLRLSPPAHVNGIEKRTSPVIMHTQYLTAVPKLVQLNTKPKLVASTVQQQDAIPTIDLDKSDDAVDVSMSSQNIREKLKRQIIQKTHSDEQTAKSNDVQQVLSVERVEKSHTPMQSTTPKNKLVSSSTVSPTLTNEPSTDQRFERNRAAAQRYRSKMKQWKVEMLKNNTRLEEENRALRAKIEKLNIILLAHQKCSVTKAMAQGNSIPVGLPKVIIKSASSQPSDKRPLRPNKQSISNTLTPAALLTVNHDDITTNPIYFMVNQKPPNSSS